LVNLRNYPTDAGIAKLMDLFSRTKNHFVAQEIRRTCFTVLQNLSLGSLQLAITTAQPLAMDRSNKTDK